MPTKTTINPNQFKLFMTGTEWQAHVTHSTDVPLPEGWEGKEADSKAPRSVGAQGPQPNVYAAIKEQGYVHDTETPPTIILEDSPNGSSVRRVQSEGHRRVSAAAAIERDTGKPVFIPTNYVDNTAAAKRRARGYKL